MNSILINNSVAEHTLCNVKSTLHLLNFQFLRMLYFIPYEFKKYISEVNIK